MIFDFTFQDLVKLEPKLGEMLKEMQNLSRRANRDKKQPFCGLTAWEGRGCGGRIDNPPSQRLKELVGPHREEGPEQLKTWQAEYVAQAKLYDAAPWCRGFCQDEENLDYPDPDEEGHWPQKGAHP